MKTKIFILSILFCGIIFDLSAQEKGERIRNKIHSLRIAFYTEQLDFSPEESAIFWPVFKQYQNERKALRSTIGLNKVPATEIEAENMLDIMLDNQVKEAGLYKKHILSLKTDIPSSKLVKLKKTENEFKRYLLKMRKEKRK